MVLKFMSHIYVSHALDKVRIRSPRDDDARQRLPPSEALHGAEGAGHQGLLRLLCSQELSGLHHQQGTAVLCVCVSMDVMQLHVMLGYLYNCIRICPSLFLLSVSFVAVALSHGSLSDPSLQAGINVCGLDIFQEVVAKNQDPEASKEVPLPAPPPNTYVEDMKRIHDEMVLLNIYIYMPEHVLYYVLACECSSWSLCSRGRSVVCGRGGEDRHGAHPLP